MSCFSCYPICYTAVESQSKVGNKGYSGSHFFFYNPSLLSLRETVFTDIMAHEKTTCPSCGAMGIVGSVCEYCGSVIQLSTTIVEKGLSKTEKKTVSGERYAEKISKYQNVGVYNGKLAVVSIGKRYGLIDKKGDLVVGLEYDSIFIIGTIEGLFGIEKKGKFALINDDAILVTDFKYDAVNDRTVPKGLVAVYLDDKKGAVNSCGTEILPCIYDEIHILFDKYLHVVIYGEKNNKFQKAKHGVFDIYGHEILPFVSHDLHGRDGHYIVYWSGVFDIEKHRNVLPDMYILRDCKHFPNLIVESVTDGNMKGVYNVESETEILPCIYSEITIKNKWIEAANQNGKWGLFKLTGEKIASCRYDYLSSVSDEKINLYFLDYSLKLKMKGDEIVEEKFPSIVNLNFNFIFWGSILCILGLAVTSTFDSFFTFNLILVFWLLVLPIFCILNALVKKWRYKI